VAVSAEPRTGVPTSGPSLRGRTLPMYALPAFAVAAVLLTLLLWATTGFAGRAGFVVFALLLFVALQTLASFGVMVSVMNLTGYVVVEHHHHSQHSVFPIIGAHVFGMYALVLVIGTLIDRVGRTPALEVGLVVMALSTIALLWVSTVFATAVLLLGLGLGWNISFVAATAQLADRTSPTERGKLLGFNDLLGALFGAGLALLGGYALDAIGVGALAIGATAIVATPIFLIARTQASPIVREPA